MSKTPRRKRGSSNSSDGTYRVGRGRPPEHSRFRPGQSGNPRGRRKGIRNVRSEFELMMRIPVQIMLNGKPRKISSLAGMLYRLREKALNGDLRAIVANIELAEKFGLGEKISKAGFSKEDAEVWRVLQRRLLSGAAPDSSKDQETEEGSALKEPDRDEPPIERYRRKKPPKT